MWNLHVHTISLLLLIDFILIEIGFDLLHISSIPLFVA